MREPPPRYRTTKHATARWFAIVNNVWSAGYATSREAKDREAEMRVEARVRKPQRAMTVADPYWFAVLFVGAANFATAYSREKGTFDRDALVAAIVELQRRALEL